LQEAIEQAAGLPPVVTQFLRQLDHNLGPVDGTHLTWIGKSVREQRHPQLFTREELYEIRRHLKQAVDITRQKRGIDDNEVFGELWAEALAPLIKFRAEIDKQSPNITDIKRFKKSFLKNLRKLEIEPEFIKWLDSYVDERMEIGVRNHFQEWIKPIMALLKEDPLSYDDLREESGLEMAAIAAAEIAANPPKAKEQIIHEFDNGYFWYDIRSNHCDFEAKKMGHCGKGEHGTLVSLRSGEGRSVKPMITMDFDGSAIYQIKGKANKAPAEKLWPYIHWFIENMGVERILEDGRGSADGEGFFKLLQHLVKKYGKEGTKQIRFEESWTEEADELLNQFEPTIETNTQTFLELDRAEEGGDGEVGVVLRHQVFWPVKDAIVDEDADRLTWEIKQDAQAYANDTLYPNPRVLRADVFPRGVQDGYPESAVLRIELYWSDSFEPKDLNNDEQVKHEVGRLLEFLDEVQHISQWLVNPTAIRPDAEFDYGAFKERVRKRLEAYGVYRDLPARTDGDAPQTDLQSFAGIPILRRAEPEGEAETDLPLQEWRIIQRWSKIIK